MRTSIQTKILATQLSHTLLATLVLGTAAYWVMMHHFTRAQQHHLRETANHVSEGISTYITGQKAELERIAQGEAVSRYAEKYQELMLIQYFRRFSDDFTELSYVHPNGREELKLILGVTSDALFDLQDTLLFQQALKHPNQTVCLFPEPEKNSPLQTIDLAFCHKNFFDEIENVIIGKIPLHILSDKMENMHCGRTGFCMLLDAEGRILAHPDLEQVGLDLGQLNLSYTGLESGRFLGKNCMLAYSYMKNWPWVAVAVIPLDEYMEAPRSLQRTLVLVVGVLLLVSCLLSRLLAGNLARPVRQLAEAAVKVAAGDFTVRLSTTSQDELGDLCQSFNQMTEKLQHTTTSIEVLNHEIKERQTAQAGQNQLMTQLKASNQELQDFAHIVSHDLKAPLRGIKSLAGWLVDDYGDKLDETGREHLSLLGTRVDRMKNLIDGVLKYSRAGRSQPDIQSIDLNHIVHDIMDSLNAPEHIHITCPNDLPTVPYDPICITQIFQNLISNAIKYMDKDEGRINISFIAEDSQWTFKVSDNGPGIDPQYHQKIFGIFQTLQARDTYESTGIGLALVKKIIERIGGRIWLVSEEGKGSTFCFTVLREPVFQDTLIAAPPVEATSDANRL